MPRQDIRERQVSLDNITLLRDDYLLELNSIPSISLVIIILSPMPDCPLESSESSEDTQDSDYSSHWVPFSLLFEVVSCVMGAENIHNKKNRSLYLSRFRFRSNFARIQDYARIRSNPAAPTLPATINSCQ